MTDLLNELMYEPVDLMYIIYECVVPSCEPM